MTKQLSIFIENKAGSMMDVTSRLSKVGIDVRAIATFDTPEFGILRMIVDKPEEARECLSKDGFVVRVQEVLGVEIEDVRGSLNHMLELLAGEGICLSYIYSLVLDEKKTLALIFYAEEYEKAEAILREKGMKLID